MGANGMQVMSALHEIHGGAPRLQLIAKLRSCELDASYLRSAIALAMGEGGKSLKYLGLRPVVSLHAQNIEIKNEKPNFNEMESDSGGVSLSS